MRLFDWNPDKNQQLILERGVSFEQVVFLIENGGLLDELEHPNRERYPDQGMFIINIDCYVYMVPFVEHETCFLKTVIPSRKMTKLYLGDRHEEH